jgi:hypothetical protein
MADWTIDPAPRLLIARRGCCYHPSHQFGSTEAAEKDQSARAWIEQPMLDRARTLSRNLPQTDGYGQQHIAGW